MKNLCLPRHLALRLAAVAAAVWVAAAPAHAAGEHGQHGAHAAAPQPAIGRPAKAGPGTRTVKIEMTDAMRFTPASVGARKGETIRFVVTNAGKLPHEMVLGTEADLKAHNAEMMKTPQMAHTDAGTVSVAPGKTGEIVWRFTQAGTVHFACLQPGHYDAGMKGAVNVAAAEAR